MQAVDKEQGSRKPFRGRVYDVAKVPARFVRDRYLYRLARNFFDEAVAESQYQMGDLERVREYLEYAFRRRTPSTQTRANGQSDTSPVSGHNLSGIRTSSISCEHSCSNVTKSLTNSTHIVARMT